MRKTYITQSAKETQKLGGILAKKLKGGEIICLSGDLGSGKTTFAQGILKGLGVKGPHTSPTFVVIKEYKIQDTRFDKSKTRRARYKIQKIYHIDAYRVKPKDILNLGWEEIIESGRNIVIIEWAERIKRIIPHPPAGGAAWIKFEWVDPPRASLAESRRVDKRSPQFEAGENKREIIFK